MKDKRKARKRSQMPEGKNKNRRRRVVKKEKPKTFTKRFVIFLIVLSLLIFVINAFRHPYMKVSQIYVTGNERLQDTDIISSIQNPIGKNILTYNVKKNEKKLMEKDMRVDFGDLKESSYKIRLLESILKDVESKDLDVSSIDLSNGKKPVVEINEGS